MGKRISVEEWNRCLDDASYWNGYAMDDTLFVIDGKELEEVPEDLPAATVIRIDEGVIVTEDAMKQVKSLAAFVRAWEKQQAFRRVVIEVPNTVSDKVLREHLTSLGAELASQ
jgi:hypothetical protein